MVGEVGGGCGGLFGGVGAWHWRGGRFGGVWGGLGGGVWGGLGGLGLGGLGGAGILWDGPTPCTREVVYPNVHKPSSVPTQLRHLTCPSTVALSR